MLVTCTTLFFETESHYTAQGGLELRTVLLPQPLKY